MMSVMLDSFLEIIRSSTTGSLSTKRTLVLASGATMCLSTAAVAAAISRAIVLGRPVDSGAVASLATLSGFTAALASVAYRKPETVGAAAPPAGGGGINLEPVSPGASDCVGTVADPGAPSGGRP